jgi:RNA polymerase sigma factor (sigma-70 family)
VVGAQRCTTAGRGVTTIPLAPAGRHDIIAAMDKSEVTCWTMIREAAAGEKDQRERFARRYEPVVRAYLAARWRKSRALLQSIDDATQEVFLDCFKRGGVLERVVENQQSGFRAFLYGVVRNIARRAEERLTRQREQQPSEDFEPEEILADEDTLSRTFDRAWAESMVREAVETQRKRARLAGATARRRFELLRNRFYNGLKIRDIACEWGEDPSVLHHEYARARQEFRKALVEVVSFHHPGGTLQEVEQECAELLALLKK